MNEFYVYVLIDPRDNKIFYVGKGKGDRINHHFKELEKFMNLIEQGIPTSKGRFTNSGKVSMMKSIKNDGFDTVVKKLIENISEKSALVLEEILVERIGRRIIKTGTLFNLEPGGKWKYPKVVLNENEKTSIKSVYQDFPELVEIIEKFPQSAIQSEKEKEVLDYINSKK